MHREGTEQIDFGRLFEEAPNGLAVVDCDGHWLGVNRALRELIGYRGDELLTSGGAPMRAADLIGGDHDLRTLVEGGIGRCVRERRHIRRDGSAVWLRVSSLLLRDGENRPLHVVVQTEDITQAKELEDELEGEQRRLEESQQAASIGSWELDLETGVQRWSSEQFAIYGVDPADPAPRLDALLQLIHPDDRRSMLESMRANMESGATFTDEYRVMHPTIGTRTLLVRGRYLPRDAQGARPARLAGTTHDVTADREAEAARWDLAERQRLLLASLPDALVALFDDKLTCVLVEGEILGKHGIDPGHFVGRSIMETLPAEHAERLATAIRTALSGSVATAEITLAQRTYLLEVWPSRLDDQSIAGAFAVGRDITERMRSEEQLRLFATIVTQSDDAIIVGSTDGLITQWNDGARLMYGYSSQEAIGRPIAFLTPAGHDDRYGELMQRALAGQSTRLQTAHQCRDGRIIQVSLTFAPIVGPDGATLGVSTVARDITAEMQAQEALLNSQRQLFEAQALAHVGSWEREVISPRAVLSAELCRILGQPLGFSPTEEEYLTLVHVDDKSTVRQAFHDAHTGRAGDHEYRIVRPHGEIRYLHELSNQRRSADGTVTHLFAAIQDITERKRYESELQRLATHDELTGLPNRRTFDERIAGEIARARRHGHGLSLALMDVDHFKRINDTLGHPVGDRVLAHIAQALRAMVREHELIARVGGEEFAWILPEADARGALAAVRRGLAAVAANPLSATPSLTMSGGICALAGEIDATELYRRADSALLAAKDAGRDRVFIYDEARDDGQSASLGLHQPATQA